jgi:hypothetical protein
MGYVNSKHVTAYSMNWCAFLAGGKIHVRAALKERSQGIMDHLLTGMNLLHLHPYNWEIAASLLSTGGNDRLKGSCQRESHPHPSHLPVRQREERPLSPLGKKEGEGAYQGEFHHHLSHLSS